MARSDPAGKPLLSREFIAALCGLGLTLFSWYSSWEWPAWPALTTMSALFGSGSSNSFADLSFASRAAVLVGLIIENAASWALVFWIILFGGSWLRSSFSRREKVAASSGRMRVREGRVKSEE